ncbi:MAG: TMEM165/GDT1 family protein [Bacteriovoracaceae bacterium]
MDWKVFWMTFGTVFIAELGDKTQLAAMSLSASSNKTVEIALGVVIALSLAGILGVLAGKILSGFITPELMKWLSGTLFIIMGIFILVKKT